MIETIYPIYFAGTVIFALTWHRKPTVRSYFTHSSDGATFNSF